MNESQNKSGRPGAAPEAPPESDLLEALLTAVSRNWKDLLVAVAIAAAIVVGVVWFQTRAARKRDQAFIQYAVAASAGQFEEILEQFPGSKAAELSALLAARAQFDSGRYDEADRLYASFLERHADHFLAPAARLGRAHCLEASGQIEEALAAFRAFAGSVPDTVAFLIPARLGEARCLRQSGQLMEAIAVYDAILLDYPESDWVPLVEDLKDDTERAWQRAATPISALPAAVETIPPPGAAAD